MAERKPFLLRLDPELHKLLQKWADDDLRSLNGQIEFLLRESLRRSGRLRPGSEKREGDPDAAGPASGPATGPTAEPTAGPDQ